MKKIFADVAEAINDIKAGRMLILLDNPNRENEGDLYIPADKVTPQAVTTMIRKGGGLVCVAITSKQAGQLNLPLMVDPDQNTEKTKVNFTVSVNAKNGITTGVSAYDRTKTIKILVDPLSFPQDLTRPGHVLGLIAQDGGVLQRAGHTEAAIDLARLAGFHPAGVLCEILADDGRMASLADLEKLAAELKIKIVLIDDLINYIQKESKIIQMASSILPTKYGEFQIIVYSSLIDNREHTVLVLGKIRESALVRIHSQCLTGDTFFSLRCDCGQQLQQSLKLISQHGSGIIIYLNQEGRGIGLINKIKAYTLQDQGHDTVEANHALGFLSDARQYKIAADILKDLGVLKVYLLTNNPEKENQLIKSGINILKRIPLEIKPNKINKSYLSAKKQKLGHYLKLV